MIGISAQVSLYPLCQEDIGPSIDKTLRIFRKHQLAVTFGSMSTLISGDDDPIFLALKEALHAAASDGQFVMVVTLSNACPVSVDSTK